MANAVREVSVGKGHDPREFLFLAYGGTLPLFASQIAERLGISTIVIPRNSSVFCALGLLSSDYVLRTDQGVGWDLSKPEGVDRVNEIAEQMVDRRDRAEMPSRGLRRREQIEIQRTADVRFQGQEYELHAADARPRTLTEDDAAALFDEFLALYERTYGEGTAWKGVPALAGQLQRHGHRPPASARRWAPRSAERRRTPDGIARDARRSSCPTERAARARCPIYDDAAFTAGTTSRARRSSTPPTRRSTCRPATTAERDAVHELRPDSLEGAQAMSTRRLRRHRRRGPPQGAGEPHRRDGDHAGAHLRLADRHRGQGLLDLPDGHASPSTSGFSAYVLFHVGSSLHRHRRSSPSSSRRRPTCAPGDGWVVNDPHTGGAMHQGDVSIIMPTFYDGEHLGWSLRQHARPGRRRRRHLRLRAGRPRRLAGGHAASRRCGSSATARSTPSGRTTSPPTCAPPAPVLNDIRSMIASNNTATNKLNQIDRRVRPRGPPASTARSTRTSASRCCASGSPRSPTASTRPSTGTSSTATTGPDQLLELRLQAGGRRLRPALQLLRRPADRRLRQLDQGPMFGQAMTGLMTMLVYGDLPVNGGLWRPVKVDLGEPGTIVNAVPPAPVSNAHSEVGMRACKLVKDVLNQAMSLSDDPVLRGRVAGQHVRTASRPTRCSAPTSTAARRSSSTSTTPSARAAARRHQGRPGRLRPDVHDGLRHRRRRDPRGRRPGAVPVAAPGGQLGRPRPDARRPVAGPGLRDPLLGLDGRPRVQRVRRGAAAGARRRLPGVAPATGTPCAGRTSPSCCGRPPGHARPPGGRPRGAPEQGDPPRPRARHVFIARSGGGGGLGDPLLRSVQAVFGTSTPTTSRPRTPRDLRRRARRPDALDEAATAARRRRSSASASAASPARAEEPASVGVAVVRDNGSWACGSCPRRSPRRATTGARATSRGRSPASRPLRRARDAGAGPGREPEGVLREHFCPSARRAGRRRGHRRPRDAPRAAGRRRRRPGA